jgi:beta propeller repeat protein
VREIFVFQGVTLLKNPSISRREDYFMFIPKMKRRGLFAFIGEGLNLGSKTITIKVFIFMTISFFALFPGTRIVSAGGTIQITDWPNIHVTYAFPCGDIIVWQSGWHKQSTQPEDIYMCDLNKNGSDGGCMATDTPITVDNHPASSYFPVCEGGYISWADQRLDPPDPNIPQSGGDIYICDIRLNGQYGGCLATNTKVRITRNTGVWQCCPEIWGEVVVWQDGRNGATDSYMYDLALDSDNDGLPNWLEDSPTDPRGNGRPTPDPAEYNLTPGLAVDQGWPSIDGYWSGTNRGYRIVWNDARISSNAYEIFMYDLGPDGKPPGTEVRITNTAAHEQSPEIEGNWIVYLYNANTISPSCYAPGSNCRVMAYNLSTNNRFSVRDPQPTNTFRLYPMIYDGVVIWEEGVKIGDILGDDPGDLCDIYMYNIVTGATTNITSDPSVQQIPEIHGDKITYSQFNGQNMDIYMYDFGYPVITVTSPEPGKTYPPDQVRLVYSVNEPIKKESIYYQLDNGPPQPLQSRTGDILLPLLSYNDHIITVYTEDVVGNPCTPNCPSIPFTVSGVEPYDLVNPDAGGPYNSCNIAHVTWDVIGSTGAPNYINIEYLLADGTSLEVISYDFSPTVESDISHAIVSGVETMQDTTVWIYFADDAIDRHDDLGTSNRISTTYTSYIKGDVSGDNYIRVNDLLIYLRYIVNLPVDNVNPIDDLTCDNAIRIDDVYILLRKIVGYDEDFCCPSDLP